MLADIVNASSESDSPFDFKQLSYYLADLQPGEAEAMPQTLTIHTETDTTTNLPVTITRATHVGQPERLLKLSFVNSNGNNHKTDILFYDYGQYGKCDPQALCPHSQNGQTQFWEMKTDEKSLKTASDILLKIAVEQNLDLTKLAELMGKHYDPEIVTAILQSSGLILIYSSGYSKNPTPNTNAIRTISQLQ